MGPVQGGRRTGGGDQLAQQPQVASADPVEPPYGEILDVGPEHVGEELARPGHGQRREVETGQQVPPP
ncbi:hypothetical protein [Microbispora triticiradicis]|uniref:hypothetical protein n=1 Tax=Microbispora triticiradicis TaxID=2200763 RepID=UPI001AD82442|nr:hypothetical protein [Microbispora triticiradicis]